MEYPPLQLLKKSQNLGKEFTSRKAQLINSGCKNLEKMTVNDYINYMLSDDFYNPWSNHKYNDITKLFMMNAELFKNDISRAEEENDVELSLKTEWKDLYLAPVLLEEWSKFKQVYKPDKDFADALLKTQKLQISTSMIEHLPCNFFYVDLSDCNNMGHTVGAFVFVVYNKIMQKLDFCIYQLTDQELYFSYYSGGYFDEKGILQVDFSIVDDKNYTISLDFVEKSVKAELEKTDDIICPTNRKDIALLMVQLVAYLSIEEPQITESDLTKGTYVPKLPSAKVKNKWSEVKIDDVGVKYGTSFRKQIQVLKEQSEKEVKIPSDNKRKSPVPHFRCAHWHKYWVGQGRQELRLKWIEPVFVGNGEVNKNIIIHKIGE